MSLTLPNARKLLRQIVGNGQGFYTTVATRYLALSSTEPVPNPSTDSYANYNITEPSEASYARAAISPSFTEEATSEVVEQAIVYSITNTSEIHFQEALEPWNGGNAINYFAIFENSNKGTGTPVYVGNLYSYSVATVTAENFDAMVVLGIYTYANSTYTKVTSEDTYDSTKTYYTRADGVVITAGTVPLIRAGFLKISVQ